MMLEYFRYVESRDELRRRQRDWPAFLVPIKKWGVIDRVTGFTGQALQPADEFSSVLYRFAGPLVTLRRLSDGPECSIVGQARPFLEAAGGDFVGRGFNRFNQGKHGLYSATYLARILS